MPSAGWDSGSCCSDVEPRKQRYSIAIASCRTRRADWDTEHGPVPPAYCTPLRTIPT